MPSAALTRWGSVQLDRLAEIETAHRAVGGSGPGRRVATQQINDAFLVLLAGQWQEFCRNLHTEAADIVAQAMPASAQVAVQAAFTLGRNLDRGNATPENIRGDNVIVMSLGEPLNPGEIRVGARAHIWLGGILHEVEIIEDRGVVPSTGHRIVRIRLLDSEDTSLDFEVPADRLVRRAGNPASPTDRPSGRRRGTRRVPA